MAIKRNLLYLVDNKCYFFSEKKDTLFSFAYKKEIIKNGIINNEEQFIKETTKFLKDNRLLNSILGLSINLIVNPIYEEKDLLFTKNVLERIMINKVEITKYFDCLDLDIANYLEINNEYLLLFYQDQYHNKSYKYIPIDFFINQNKINEYIKDLLSHSNKSIYVYGQNCNLKSINALEKVCGNRVYLIENSEAFILSLCSKWTM